MFNVKKSIFAPRGNETTTAECIVAAQMSSDAGKDPLRAKKFWGDIPWSNEPLEGGYGVKPFYIYRAMMTILQDTESRFRFSVKKTVDQNGIPSYVVAFRHQFFLNEDLSGHEEPPIIAFHIPEGQSQEIKKFLRCSMQFSFSPEIGATSRGNARRLAQNLGWCKPREEGIPA